MDYPKASELLELRPGPDRDKVYRFPYTGPYEGEPQLYEILHLKEWDKVWGSSHLTIYKTCPACGSTKAEWIRLIWAICFDCELAFDAFECYIDLTIDEEMETMYE